MLSGSLRKGPIYLQITLKEGESKETTGLKFRLGDIVQPEKAVCGDFLSSNEPDIRHPKTREWNRYIVSFLELYHIGQCRSWMIEASVSYRNSISDSLAVSSNGIID